MINLLLFWKCFLGKCVVMFNGEKSAQHKVKVQLTGGDISLI